MVEQRDRAKIGQQLRADFDRYIVNINEANLIAKDEAKEKKVYAFQEGSWSYLQAFITDTVLKPADYAEFCRNWVDNMAPFLKGKVSFFKIEDDQGHQCVRQKVPSPISEYIVSSRQIFQTYYPFLDEESPLFLVSGRGNEYLAEKYRKEVNKDVVAEYDLNGLRFDPLKNDKGEVIGTRVTQVCRYDTKGSLPGVVKGIINS